MRSPRNFHDTVSMDMFYLLTEVLAVIGSVFKVIPIQ